MTIIFWITLRFVKRDRKESNQKRHQMEHSQSFSSWQSVCDHWSGTFWGRRRRRRNGKREKEKSEEVYFYQHWKYEGRKGGRVSGVSKPEILRNSCKRVTRKHWTDWTDRGTSAEKNRPIHKESLKKQRFLRANVKRQPRTTEYLRKTHAVKERPWPHQEGVTSREETEDKFRIRINMFRTSQDNDTHIQSKKLQWKAAIFGHGKYDYKN